MNGPPASGNSLILSHSSWSVFWTKCLVVRQTEPRILELSTYYKKPKHCCTKLAKQLQHHATSATIFKFEPIAHNMSQHDATGWPNARNVLLPAMLCWNVAIVLPLLDRENIYPLLKHISSYYEGLGVLIEFLEFVSNFCYILKKL